ncbi:MAG TPA: acyl-CoA dehydrogenase family protein [Trebonia sp.]
MATTVAQELMSAADGVVRRELARPGVRSAARGAGWSKDLWAATAAAGWADVLLAEEHGGLGLGLDAAAELFSVIGRNLVPGPYADLVVTVPLIYPHAPAAVRSRLDAARAGAEIVLLVDPAATGAASGIMEFAGGALTGTAGLVRHAPVADGFLVPVHDPASGSALAYVGASDPRVTVRPGESFDFASPVAHVSFDHVTVAPQHLVPATGELTVSGLRARLRLVIAAELAGLARHLLDASVSYAKLREQFGKPIGSFQAVQQILAEMAVQLMGTEALTAELAQGGDAGLAEAIMAKGLASEIARTIGEAALQVHGGIAFTEEFEDNRWYLHILTLHGLYGDHADCYRVTGDALLTQEFPIQREARF